MQCDDSPTPARPALLELLLSLLSRLSYRRGMTTLASGRRSDFYIDCKQTLLNAHGASLVGRLCWDRVQQLRAAGQPVVGVGGLSLGADPIAVATALCSAESPEPVHAFIIRKEPKGHGTRAYLEGSANLPAGSPVLIVEDVVTTGASTQKAVERARLADLQPIAILALVDREEGGEAALQHLGLPFSALLRRRDFIDPAAAPSADGAAHA
jgi:orotate phosphoribosyltransferase